MPRQKLKRINEVLEFDNVFSEPVKFSNYLLGQIGNLLSTSSDLGEVWRGNAIVLELGCGHGYYTLALANKYPDKFFIGVDRKGDRLWKARKRAVSSGLHNVAFIKAHIEKFEDFFGHYISHEENGGVAYDFLKGNVKKDGAELVAPIPVDEIWITFPDPYLKPSKSGRRLTSENFLKIYKKLLKPSGIIHLKTDNKHLFDYSIAQAKAFGCDMLEICEDIHNACSRDEAGGIKNELLDILTFYEERFMSEGKPIYYMKYKF